MFYQKIFALILVLFMFINMVSLNEASSNETLFSIGRFEVVESWSLDYRPRDYRLYSIGSEWFIVYTSELETYIIRDNDTLTLSTIGSAYYYIVDDKLLITSIGGQGFDVYLVDPLMLNVLISYSKTLNSYIFRNILGVYYEYEDKLIHIYYSVESMDFTREIVVVSIDLVSSSIRSIDILEDEEIVFIGNVIFGIESYRYRTFVLDQLVTIRKSNNLLYLTIGNCSAMFEGGIYVKLPVIYIDDTLYFILYSSNSLSIVEYSDGIFRSSNFTLEFDGYSFDNIYPLSNSIVLEYRRNNDIILSYIDPYSLEYVKTVNLINTRDLYSFTIDLDLDDYFEPIIYNGRYYELIFTSNGTHYRVYWDKLFTPIHYRFNVALVNNTLYYVLVLEDNMGYRVELLRFSSERIDLTPPIIELYSPLDKHVYVDRVSLNVSAYDLESSVYCIEISIGSGLEHFYSKRIYGGVFYSTIDLDHGIYWLNITAWNIDGSMNTTRVWFYIVDYDINIVEPSNYSVLKPLFSISILSGGDYLISISVNDTFISNYTLSYGLNHIVLNISGFDDGLLDVSFYVWNTSRAYHLLIYKDSIAPSLMVYGLSNNTIVSGVLEFTVEAYDLFFDNITIYLGTEIIYVDDEPGVHNISVDTRFYPNDEYLLVTQAYDQAGNVNVSVFKLFFNNVGEPYLTIVPEPFNNTFVSGVLNYSVYGINIVRIEILVNGTLLYLINSSSGVLNTTIVFNTIIWRDDVYLVIFNATGYGGLFVTKKYVWFVDNSPPELNMHIPAIGWGGVWSNNSVVPRFNPAIHNVKYIIEHDGSEYFIIYVNVSDRWLSNATLYINGSIASILLENRVYPSIFNESGGYLSYLEIPGEGYYILRLIGYDRVGHLSEYVLGVWFDLSPPEFTLLSPLNNSLMNTKLLNITYYVSDNVSLRVSLGFNIQANQYRRLSLDEYTPLFPYPIVLVNDTYSSTFELRMGDGIYYLSFLIVDQGMNYVVQTYIFRIDTTPPYVNLTYNVSGYTLSIYLNISDNLSGFSNGSIYLDNELLDEIMDTIFYGEYLLEPGNHTLTIIVYDSIGNVYNETFTIEIPYQESLSPIETLSTNMTTKKTSSELSITPTTTSMIEEPMRTILIVIIVVGMLSLIVYMVLRRR